MIVLLLPFISLSCFFYDLLFPEYPGQGSDNSPAAFYLFLGFLEYTVQLAVI